MSISSDYSSESLTWTVAVSKINLHKTELTLIDSKVKEKSLFEKYIKKEPVFINNSPVTLSRVDSKKFSVIFSKDFPLKSLLPLFKCEVSFQENNDLEKDHKNKNKVKRTNGFFVYLRFFPKEARFIKIEPKGSLAQNHTLTFEFLEDISKDMFKSAIYYSSLIVNGLSYPLKDLDLEKYHFSLECASNLEPFYTSDNFILSFPKSFNYFMLIHNSIL